MGCGASSIGSSDVRAPGAAPGPPASGHSVLLPPPPQDGDSEWHLMVPAARLEHVALGAHVPGWYLVLARVRQQPASAADAAAPPPLGRLWVVSLDSGALEPVAVRDKGRGLAAAAGAGAGPGGGVGNELQCLFVVDQEQQQQQLQQLMWSMRSSNNHALMHSSVSGGHAGGANTPSRTPVRMSLQQGLGLGLSPQPSVMQSGQLSPAASQHLCWPPSPSPSAMGQGHGHGHTRLAAPQPLYCGVTERGDAFLFKLVKRRGLWVAHSVRRFKLAPPGGQARFSDIHTARTYLEGGQLYVEYGSHGGMTVYGTPVIPWVARHPLDIKAVQQGTFEVRPAHMAVTYWPDALDGDPAVRQCTCLGQAVGMARYGQLFSAARAADPDRPTTAGGSGGGGNGAPGSSGSGSGSGAAASGISGDGASRGGCMSYVLERLPGAQAGGVENVKPLFRVRGCCVGAVLDVTREVSVLAADDDGGEAALTALHRHSGMAWRVPLAPPPPPPPLPGSPWARGGAARLYGISGLAPVDPTRNPADSDSDVDSEDGGPATPHRRRQRHQQHQPLGQTPEEEDEPHSPGAMPLVDLLPPAPRAPHTPPPAAAAADPLGAGAAGTPTTSTTVSLHPPPPQQDPPAPPSQPEHQPPHPPVASPRHAQPASHLPPLHPLLTPPPHPQQGEEGHLQDQEQQQGPGLPQPIPSPESPQQHPRVRGRSRITLQPLLPAPAARSPGPGPDRVPQGPAPDPGGSTHSGQQGPGGQAGGQAGAGVLTGPVLQAGGGNATGDVEPGGPGAAAVGGRRDQASEEQHGERQQKQLGGPAGSGFGTTAWGGGEGAQGGIRDGAGVGAGAGPGAGARAGTGPGEGSTCDVSFQDIVEGRR